MQVTPPPLPSIKHQIGRRLVAKSVFAGAVLSFLILVAGVTLYRSIDSPAALTFNRTSFVRENPGSVKVIGFATNNSRRFITMAVVKVSFLLEDGQVFTPPAKYVISLFACPGQSVPFHTGWMSVPKAIALRDVRLISCDIVRDYSFWEVQAAKRNSIRVTSQAQKTQWMMGVRGTVETGNSEASSVHAAFAFYDEAGTLCDVQSWTVRPKKTPSKSLRFFDFQTGSTQTDPAINPFEVKAFVQHFETSVIRRPDYIPTEPSVQ